MILQLNSDINAIINSDEETKLHLAAKNNLKYSGKYYIEAGADVNAKCSQLETPLHKAAQEGHKDMVKILIKNGASINEKNVYGETALHKAVWRHYRDCSDYGEKWSHHL